MDAVKSLMERYVGAGVAESDDDRRRLRKRSLTLAVTLVCVLSPFWILTYLLLGRPLSAAIPGGYVLFSLVGLAVLFATKREAVFLGLQVVAILVLPVALQWSLGGFVQGSAVMLWSFASVLVALIAWGPRAATTVFAAFVVAVIVSALAEAGLRSAVSPLPRPIEIGFFAMNVSAPLATAFALLVYFTRERDAAMAASDRLLHNILPGAVVRQLQSGRRRIADRHDGATVAFIDFVGFTAFADGTDPERVVEVLDRAFSTLDALAEVHGVEKIKTLGDGYLVAGGVTEPRSDHAIAVVEMALATRDELRSCLADDWPEVDVRVGIASGPVVAGVIGERRIGFDLWGDTVNMASRMATHADPGTVQVTGSTVEELPPTYRIVPRGDVDVKGKGRMPTYLLAREDG